MTKAHLNSERKMKNFGSIFLILRNWQRLIIKKVIQNVFGGFMDRKSIYEEMSSLVKASSHLSIFWQNLTLKIHSWLLKTTMDFYRKVASRIIKYGNYLEILVIFNVLTARSFKMMNMCLGLINIRKLFFRFCSNSFVAFQEWYLNNTIILKFWKEFFCNQMIFPSFSPHSQHF